MLSLRERLIAARARIAPPEHWTKGVFARTKEGVLTYPASPEAACWCLVGTLRANVGQFSYCNDILPVGDVVRKKTNFNNCAEFNDHKDTTHAMVLAVLDEAIARC